jgi:hypothetical protein
MIQTKLTKEDSSRDVSSSFVQALLGSERISSKRIFSLRINEIFSSIIPRNLKSLIKNSSSTLDSSSIDLPRCISSVLRSLSKDHDSSMVDIHLGSLEGDQSYSVRLMRDSLGLSLALRPGLMVL